MDTPSKVSVEANKALDVEQVEVTPAMAGEMLTKNPHNRFPSERRVRRYARDMEDGAWMLTHQPIAFDQDGNILDGQQRLLAIQRSNTSQPFLVVRNAPRESFFVVDTGKPRSLADALVIMGEQNARQQASVVNLAYRVEQGGQNGAGPGHVTPPIVRALAYYDAGPPDAFREAQKRGALAHYQLHGPLSAYGGVYFHTAKIDLEEADWFIDHFGHGHNMGQNHPVLRLRETVIDLVREAPAKTVDRTYVAAIMFKAWNAFRDGKELKTLTYRPGGSNPEPFPKPK